MLEGAGRSKRQRRPPAWLLDAQTGTASAGAAASPAQDTSNTAGEHQHATPGTATVACAGDSSAAEVTRAPDPAARQQTPEQQTADSRQQQCQQQLHHAQSHRSTQRQLPGQAGMQAYEAAATLQTSPAGLQQQQPCPDLTQQQQSTQPPPQSQQQALAEHSQQPAHALTHRVSQDKALSPTEAAVAAAEAAAAAAAAQTSADRASAFAAAHAPANTQAPLPPATHQDQPTTTASEQAPVHQLLQQRPPQASQSAGPGPVSTALEAIPPLLQLLSCDVEDHGRVLLVSLQLAHYIYTGRLTLMSDLQQEQQPQAMLQQQDARQHRVGVQEGAARPAPAEEYSRDRDAPPATAGLPQQQKASQEAARAAAQSHVSQHQQQHQQAQQRQPNAGVIGGLLDRTVEAVRQERLQQQEHGTLTRPVGLQSMMPARHQQQRHQARSRELTPTRRSARVAAAAAGGDVQHAPGHHCPGRALVGLLSAFALQQEQQSQQLQLGLQQQQECQQLPQQQPQQQQGIGAGPESSHPVVVVPRARARKQPLGPTEQPGV